MMGSSTYGLQHHHPHQPSIFISDFICPDQKDQVAESNYFFMKRFAIGHVSAAPDRAHADTNGSSKCKSDNIYDPVLCSSGSEKLTGCRV